MVQIPLYYHFLNKKDSLPDKKTFSTAIIFFLYKDDNNKKQIKKEFQNNRGLKFIVDLKNKIDTSDKLKNFN